MPLPLPLLLASSQKSLMCLRTLCRIWGEMGSLLSSLSKMRHRMRSLSLLQLHLFPQRICRLLSLKSSRRTMHLLPSLVPQSLELPECARRRDCLPLAPALAHTFLRVPTGSCLEHSASHPLLHLQKILLHLQLQIHLLSRLLSPSLLLHHCSLLWRPWTTTMTLRMTTQSAMSLLTCRRRKQLRSSAD